MSNPHAVTREFERAVADYCGAPYCVAVSSCTMALTLAVAYHARHGSFWEKGYARGIDYRPVEIPSRTYISVPMAIMHAGCKPVFRDEGWLGAYQLKPLPVWDSARWFTSKLWLRARGMVCVSFHASKTLGDTQGGAILHDDKEADAWLRRARFDGRTEGVAPKDDTFTQVGWHCYMNPDTAARLLWKLSVLPKNNAPMINDDYPDLSKMEIFK